VITATHGVDHSIDLGAQNLNVLHNGPFSELNRVVVGRNDDDLQHALVVVVHPQLCPKGVHRDDLGSSRQDVPRLGATHVCREPHVKTHGSQ
jgi:hypothetical protein